MKKLISLFTALFLLMSALPAQAESPEISDLLTEYYKEYQELPFGLTEDELTAIGRFAATAASLSTQYPGGISAIVPEETVLRCMEG